MDAEYLSDALGRAGRPIQVGHLELARLDGGRILASVFSLKADADAFVLKKFMPEPWRISLFGSAFNEPASMDLRPDAEPARAAVMPYDRCRLSSRAR